MKRKTKKKIKYYLCLAIASLILFGTLVFLGYEARRHSEVNNQRSFLDGYGYCVGVYLQPRAETKPQAEAIQETQKELVEYYAKKFGVSESLLACVVKKESGGNALASGDNGKAKGLTQFHLGTYKAFRTAMGLSTIDERVDKAEAIKTTAWALSMGYGYHWTAYRKCL